MSPLCSWGTFAYPDGIKYNEMLHEKQDMCIIDTHVSQQGVKAQHWGAQLDYLYKMSSQ
jgi:hypothetical protein